ncbi:MAG TPA: AMP-binding protein, partial [Mycobacterium sp.]|nr:AMP-binding protein [Mycobacterium sp.]
MGATFWDLVVAAADEHPDRILVADPYGRELTTAGLRDAAEQAAAGLGLAAGDVVSWQLPTVLEAIVLMAAVGRVGALQNPIIPLLREREIRLIATQLGTTKLVVPTFWRGFDYAAITRAIATDTALD